jgi:purine-binding chemotaxis protein CheW
MSVLHIVFSVDKVEYVLPASEVLHMESFTGATRVPGTLPYVAGLVQVRGRVLPVIDLRVRFGLQPREATLDSRILIVQQGTRVVGLLVDSAREILRIDPDALRAPPELIGEQAAGFVTQVAEVGERFVMRVDAKQIIGEETIHGE